jgi:hypothetical protein
LEAAGGSRREAYVSWVRLRRSGKGKQVVRLANFNRLKSQHASRPIHFQPVPNPKPITMN